MDSRTLRWVRAAARVVGWLAGGRPCDVWPTYRTFEEDSGTLFDTVEDFYGSVKPILEERERAREDRETAEAASHLVPVPTERLANDERPEEVKSNRRVVR